MGMGDLDEFLDNVGKSWQSFIEIPFHGSIHSPLGLAMASRLGLSDDTLNA